IKKINDMKNASICVTTGTTTELNLADQFRKRGLKYKAVVFEDPDAVFGAYEQGRCDGVTTDMSGLVSRKTILKDPAAHVILPEVMSKEPLGPAWAHGDNNWGDIIRWLVYGLMTAEERGITSKNVDQCLNSKDPEIARLLGDEKELGKAMGLDKRFIYNAIKQVGNYGEIFAKNLGPGTPFNPERGLNDLWTRGGLLYAPPLRQITGRCVITHRQVPDACDPAPADGFRRLGTASRCPLASLSLRLLTRAWHGGGRSESSAFSPRQSSFWPSSLSRDSCTPTCNVGSRAAG
ncbi:MAG: hypothetical protein ACE5JD_12760, partial [Candidatus Methylomirabilia bacterium]